MTESGNRKFWKLPAAVNRTQEEAPAFGALAPEDTQSANADELAENQGTDDPQRA